MKTESTSPHKGPNKLSGVVRWPIVWSARPAHQEIPYKPPFQAKDRPETWNKKAVDWFIQLVLLGILGIMLGVFLEDVAPWVGRAAFFLVMGVGLSAFFGLHERIGRMIWGSISRWKHLRRPPEIKKADVLVSLKGDLSLDMDASPPQLRWAMDWPEDVLPSHRVKSPTRGVVALSQKRAALSLTREPGAGGFGCLLIRDPTTGASAPVSLSGSQWQNGVPEALAELALEGFEMSEAHQRDLMVSLTWISEAEGIPRPTGWPVEVSEVIAELAPATARAAK